MKNFEIFNQISNNGQRRFKVVLHEVYPDSCVIDGLGSITNRNGICWIQRFCEDALSTIQGQSLKCEFADADRTELLGHGETGFSEDDGLPLFENATMIGPFDKAYIDQITDQDGVTKTVCIGEGTIDSLCYHALCQKLDEEIANGNAPFGSVEILRSPGLDSIIYLDGHTQQDFGRIPEKFMYSGFALLGVRPADPTARIIELNNEVGTKMTEDQIRQMITDAINEMTNANVEMQSVREKCAADVALKDNEIAELNKQIDALKSELEACKTDKDELSTAKDQATTEMQSLKDEMSELQKANKVNEMNSAIADFSDEEKKYAESEINSFNENPDSCEINSIVTKIWEGIGKTAKQAKADAQAVAEQNAAKAKIDMEDIFGEVTSKQSHISDAVTLEDIF